MTTVDRFQILEASQLQLPHKCAICGGFSNEGGRKFVSWDLWIEFYGNVYICTICFIGAAKSIGVVTSEHHNIALAQVKAFKAVVETYMRECDDLRAQLDSLRNSVSTYADSNSDTDSSYKGPAEPTSPAVVPAEQRSDEQIDVRRSPDLQNDDRFNADVAALGLGLHI